jgi:ketosteroid isomerase-like protein
MGTPGNDKKQIAVRCLEAWTSGRFASARAVLEEDATFVGPLAKSTGVDEYIEGVRGFVTSMVKGIEVHQVIADGDDVCVMYDLLTNAGAVPSTGWYRIREGKVAAVRAFFDPRLLMGEGQASAGGGAKIGGPPPNRAP